MSTLAQKISRKINRTAKSAARMRMLPAYLCGAAKNPEKFPIVYIVEDANWSIKWDGIHTTRELEKFGRAACIDTSSSFHSGKILHFGSAYVFETQAFRPISANNEVVVTFFHGRYGDDAGTDRRLDLLRKNIDRIDAVAVSNSIMRKRFIGMGIPEQKIFLVPIGVDLNIFKPLPAAEKAHRRGAMKIPVDAFVVGSFQKDGHGWGDGAEPKLIKGPDIFVEAMTRLSKTRKIFCLLSGPARGYVKAGLERAGIAYAHHFFENPDDVCGLYQILDAYAVTSREEGGPKAIIEALACGVPLVTTRVGMAEDVLEGQDCGTICEIEDAESVSAALSQIAENKAFSERMRENGLRRVKDYDWAHVALACEELYKTLEHQKRRKR